MAERVPVAGSYSPGASYHSSGSMPSVCQRSATTAASRPVRGLAYWVGVQARVKDSPWKARARKGLGALTSVCQRKTSGVGETADFADWVQIWGVLPHAGLPD